MSEIIQSPGITAAQVYAMQNTPRAKIANKLYSIATGIKNRAGAFVGYALTQDQLQEILHAPEVRGRDLARDFFNRYSQDTGAAEVGRFILTGTEIDMFLDLLAGLTVQKFNKPGEIITPYKTMPADEINKKDPGRRW